MTLIRFKNYFSVLLAALFLFSCESVKDFVGLSDENIEQELISSTPELVLPPDFGKQATKSIKRKQNSSPQQSLDMPNFPTNYSVKSPLTHEHMHL